MGTAKTLGGVGSILELIPFVSIVGYILTLVAVKYVSDELQDSSIFNNMLYAVITGIVGAVVGFLVLLGGFRSPAFTSGMSGIAGAIGFLAVAWIALIISAIFIRRAFGTMAGRLDIRTFRTAGTLYLVGAALTIVLVGFIILFVAYIYQVISFFSIPETAQAPTPATPAAPAQPLQGMKYCPSCGAQMPAASTFCPSCGAKQP
jgi:uncharacterized membrane protein